MFAKTHIISVTSFCNSWFRNIHCTTEIGRHSSRNLRNDGFCESVLGEHKTRERAATHNSCLTVRTSASVGHYLDLLLTPLLPVMDLVSALHLKQFIRTTSDMSSLLGTAWASPAGGNCSLGKTAALSHWCNCDCLSILTLRVRPELWDQKCFKQQTTW